MANVEKLNLLAVLFNPSYSSRNDLSPNKEKEHVKVSKYLINKLVDVKLKIILY